MGGGGRSAPAGPTPQQVAQAQIEAQRREQERLQNERNTNASNFLANNPITDEFRADIGNQSQRALDRQFGLLDNQARQTRDDIRQRQAGRGLSQSRTRFDLDRQAGTLAGQSRQDILDAGRRRVENRVNQQEQLLNRAANAIRGGTPVAVAENQFRSDLEGANRAFEAGLRSAQTQDQRNQAYLDFEARRQQSAARFKESMNRMEDDSLLAARAVNQPEDEDEQGAGQGFGTSPTNII